MGILILALKSLRNRRFTTFLTLISISLSVALLLGVERVRQGARDSFANTISQTDLIVGAKGGTVQLLLYAVFRMGSATNNISYESYQKIKAMPEVQWTIPFSLGDSHKGFRVVGTNEDFYSKYRYRGDKSVHFAEGKVPEGVFDVALGSDVATKLKYKLGDDIVITHGVSTGPGIINHSDKPFKLVGILDKTNTPIDRSIYITLEGMEAAHIDWSDGAQPVKGKEIPASSIKKEDIKIGQITAFLLRAQSRIQTLSLQRTFNTFPDEPLMAIIPGVVLNELWDTIGHAEDALKFISFLVVGFGFLSMLIALYTSLNERRREISILRAIGAGKHTIILLLVAESTTLSVVGAVIGVGLLYGLLYIGQPFIELQFGFHLPINPLSNLEYTYLVGIVITGFLIGFIPAIKGYRNSLSDGLSIRI